MPLSAPFISHRSPLPSGTFLFVLFSIKNNQLCENLPVSPAGLLQPLKSHFWPSTSFPPPEDFPEDILIHPFLSDLGFSLFLFAAERYNWLVGLWSWVLVFWDTRLRPPYLVRRSFYGQVMGSCYGNPLLSISWSSSFFLVWLFLILIEGPFVKPLWSTPTR